jgi:hypothetical protein
MGAPVRSSITGSPFSKRSGRVCPQNGALKFGEKLKERDGDIRCRRPCSGPTRRGKSPNSSVFAEIPVENSRRA